MSRARAVFEGLDIDRVPPLVQAARGIGITVAGGVTTPAELADLDRLGADAQVGMAIYSGKLDLADAFAAPLVSDRPDGLWPTVVTDERGVCLGLVYSNAESLRAAVDEGRGIYWSRRRGLWRKGETSGDVQELLKVEADCDRDALKFTVRQDGDGFCHRGTRGCWARNGDSAPSPVDWPPVGTPPPKARTRRDCSPNPGCCPRSWARRPGNSRKPTP